MNYETFCKLFSEYVPPAMHEGERYYLANDAVESFRSGEKRKPYAKGLFLGMGHREFIPSPALLQILSKHSNKKAVLKDDKAEWLFVCGRDIFPGYYETKITEGYVLVQNQYDENLGLGKIELDGKQGIIIKNILDSGNYLRHEQVKM